MKISAWSQFTLSGVALLLLCFLHHVSAESYRSYYSRIFNRRLPSPSTAPPLTPPSPPSALEPSIRDRSLYSRIFNRRFQGVSTVSPPTQPPVPARGPAAVAVPSMVDRITASLNPASTVPSLGPGDIPKSALAVLTGDPDYTRFRQAWLRQMCQRLLNSSRANSFQLCFSLLSFGRAANPV